MMTVAIGVGDYKKFEDQLVAIAGDHVYTLDDFDDLSDVFTDILKETCSKPVTQIISILNKLRGFLLGRTNYNQFNFLAISVNTLEEL